MKIKAKVDFRYSNNDGHFEIVKDRIIDIPIELARDFIEQGLAEEVFVKVRALINFVYFDNGYFKVKKDEEIFMSEGIAKELIGRGFVEEAKIEPLIKNLIKKDKKEEVKIKKHKEGD